jgi:hypothetical protein
MSKMEERNTSPFSTQVVIRKQCFARCFWVTTSPESATRLHLGTPVRETLDVRPSLPSQRGAGITSSLHSSTIVHVESNSGLGRNSISEKKSPRSDACVVPLADLSVVQPEDEAALVVPDSLLGGSTCDVHLDRISRITKTALSATDLVHLSLLEIPHSVYCTFPPMRWPLTFLHLRGSNRLYLFHESP